MYKIQCAQKQGPLQSTTGSTQVNYYQIRGTWVHLS